MPVWRRKKKDQYWSRADYQPFHNLFGRTYIWTRQFYCPENLQNSQEVGKKGKDSNLNNPSAKQLVLQDDGQTVVDG
jgi:hypothetical protein